MIKVSGRDTRKKSFKPTKNGKLIPGERIQSIGQNPANRNFMTLSRKGMEESKFIS